MCPLGFGFVGFESEEIVEQVCQTRFHQLNGKTVCTYLSLLWLFPIIFSFGGVGCLVAKGHKISQTNVLYSFLSFSLSLQVEVKKAEPRYATASATGGSPYGSNMQYGNPTAAGATTYGGKNECVPPC